MYLNLKMVKLVLGNDYIVCGNIRTAYRLVKTTPKGYNLLNLRTSKCSFKHHLYPLKGFSDEKNLSFYMLDTIWFEPYLNSLGNTNHAKALKAFELEEGKAADTKNIKEMAVVSTLEAGIRYEKNHR
jgi:hypothetical protein